VSLGRVSGFGGCYGSGSQSIIWQGIVEVAMDVFLGASYVIGRIQK